jgi:hypothetical protein
MPEHVSLRQDLCAVAAAEETRIRGWKREKSRDGASMQRDCRVVGVCMTGAPGAGLW